MIASIALVDFSRTRREIGHDNEAVGFRHPEHRLGRGFTHPRKRVWRAFTEPKLLAQWWGRGNRLDVEQLEVRRGGHWRFVEYSDDGPHGFEGRFRGVKQPEWQKGKAKATRLLINYSIRLHGTIKQEAHAFEVNSPHSKVESLEIISYDAESGTFPATVYSSMSGDVNSYIWRIEGDTVIHAGLGFTYRGTFSEDGRTLTGSWRPDEEAKAALDNAYDAVMTREGRSA